VPTSHLYYLILLLFFFCKTTAKLKIWIYSCTYTILVQFSIYIIYVLKYQAYLNLLYSEICSFKINTLRYLLYSLYYYDDFINTYITKLDMHLNRACIKEALYNYFCGCLRAITDTKGLSKSFTQLPPLTTSDRA